MLKHCRNLPRAGVGLLGLALVLAFTASAQASTLRRGGAQAQGSVLFGVPAGVDPAVSSPAIINPPVVQEFSVAGSMAINFSANPANCAAVNLNCNVGEICQCVEGIGQVTDGIGPLYHGSAVLDLNIVTSFPTRAYPNGNTAGQVCFFATGNLAVTVALGSTINFITSGAACNAVSGGVGLFSGGFEVGPSTGGFINAVGGGVLGFGSNFNTGVGIFDLKGAGTHLN
jgi:hypothetical protein